VNAFGDAVFGFFVLLAAGFWLLSAVVARSFASDRGRATAGFFLGLLYGPLGVVMALLLPSATDGDVRRSGSCPFCYEPVHVKATICPHCRSTLSPPSSPGT
jgi:hypothetical protein